MSVRRFAVYFAALMVCCVTAFPQWGVDANTEDKDVSNALSLSQRYFMTLSRAERWKYWQEHRDHIGVARMTMAYYRHLSEEEALTVRRLYLSGRLSNQNRDALFTDSKD